MSTDVIAEVKRDYIISLLQQGERIDGRKFYEYRNISVETGKFEKAEGSALVKIGNTQVLVGVKLGIGEPYPDSPDMGVLTTSAELVPLASPTFEPGPPDENAIELARVVDRGIRESECIDFEKLCIVEGEKVWIVFVDIHVLDYDGNLFDASSLGAIAALLNAKFPKLEDDRIIYSEKTNQGLPIIEKPIETTFAKINNKIVLDPNLDEELVMDARLTIATTEKGEYCALQKGGSGTFSQEEILEIIDVSIEKSKELRKFLR
ncbi:MAG: RNA-binding protein [Candidatus Hydrothermarchaeota archaeon]|nr:MAG: RNA-binding protein [Candidatus Hydrothermarchaeota archaeon]